MEVEKTLSLQWCCRAMVVDMTVLHCRYGYSTTDSTLYPSLPSFPKVFWLHTSMGVVFIPRDMIYLTLWGIVYSLPQLCGLISSNMCYIFLIPQCYNVVFISHLRCTNSLMCVVFNPSYMLSSFMCPCFLLPKYILHYFQNLSYYTMYKCMSYHTTIILKHPSCHTIFKHVTPDTTFKHVIIHYPQTPVISHHLQTYVM